MASQPSATFNSFIQLACISWVINWYVPHNGNTMLEENKKGYIKNGFLGQMWWHMPATPATWEVEIRRIRAAWEKSQQTQCQSISQGWWLMPVIPATWEAMSRRMQSEASPGQKLETLSKKITCNLKKEKWLEVCLKFPEFLMIITPVRIYGLCAHKKGRFAGRIPSLHSLIPVRVKVWVRSYCQSLSHNAFQMLFPFEVPDTGSRRANLGAHYWEFSCIRVNGGWRLESFPKPQGIGKFLLQQQWGKSPCISLTHQMPSHLESWGLIAHLSPRTHRLNHHDLVSNKTKQKWKKKAHTRGRQMSKATFTYFPISQNHFMYPPWFVQMDHCYFNVITWLI
jgi:hypothetical protein